MNSTPLHGRSRAQRFLLATGVVALLAGLVVAVIVIHPFGKSSAQLLSQARSYTACMRTHGLPKFPEPTLSGGSVDLTTPASITQSSAYPSAESACHHLLG